MGTVLDFRRQPAARAASAHNRTTINNMIATLIRIDPAEQDARKLDVLQHTIDMLTVARRRQPLRVASVAAASSPIDNHDFAVGFYYASNRLTAKSNGGSNGSS